ncbi:MAG: ABC transporter permease [Bacteroidota bacterium]
MIKYYLRVFARNILRHRMFSAINLLGLTTGIVSTLLIYLYVQQELSHDRFHQNADQLYRINQTFIWGDDNNQQFSSTGPGVSFALAAEIPEVKQVTRVHPPGNLLISYTNSKNEVISFDQEGILAVDSNFLSLFTFPLIKGSKETALLEPNSVVMTESTAKKYFGDEDPIGKMVQTGNMIDDESFKNTAVQPMKAYQVTGVVQDPPSNSYIDFDMLISMSSYSRVKDASWSWVWTMFETFVLLDKKASPDAVRAKLEPLPRKYAEATLQRAMGTTYDAYTKNGKQWNLYLQPLTDIHLHSSQVYNRLNSVGSIKILYVLIGIVAFIIVLSCINFMNLSTAQYTKRAKETSLRKVLGSDRWQLSFSFFVEAFLFCLISLLIGVGLTQIFLPYFNVLTGNSYSLNLLSDTTALMVIGALLLVMSLLSGSYPAVFLSAFKPVEAMKGKLRTGTEGRRIRNGLVIFQFSASIILVISTMTVFQQLRFLSHKDVGFNRENLLLLDRLEWVNDKEAFVNSLTQIPGVTQASWCSSAPPTLYDGDNFQAEGNQDRTFALNFVKADEQYVPTLDLKILVGRNFSKDLPNDVNGVILNETAAKDIGWPIDENILGKKIYYPGDERKFEVIGVVKDFNYWALQAPIAPMALFSIKNQLSYAKKQYAAIRVLRPNAQAWNVMIGELQKQWKQFAGDAPFQYEFVDQAFESTFRGDLKFGQALSVFAVLAILIASLGLLGMIIFTVELRTKEIGIRKVIGASAWSILVLLSKDYTKLIMIAIVVSIPASIWFMNEWLQGFQYRVRLSPLIFVAAGVGTLVISVLITGYHAMKAAHTNPVDVLKDE